MRSSLKWLVIGLVLVGAFQVEAQNLIPKIGGSNVTVQVSGYTHVYYSPDSTTCPNADKVGIPNDESDFQWGLCRVKMDIKSSTPFGAFMEIEAVDLNDSSKNWLRKAGVSYQANEDWVLSAGRIFLAGGFPLPGPANLETVRYPRMPFACYAYGVQVQGNLGSGMSIISDITGKSGVSFDSDENWDRLESSTRLQKKITENLSLAGMVQVSDDFGGLVLDSAYRIGKACLRGAGYTKYEEGTEGEAKDTKGFYTYAGYEVLEGVELHAQYDHQVSANDIWTVGTRVWAPQDQVSLTVDYEVVDGQSDDNRVVARMEVRF